MRHQRNRVLFGWSIFWAAAGGGFGALLGGLNGLLYGAIYWGMMGLIFRWFYQLLNRSQRNSTNTKNYGCVSLLVRVLPWAVCGFAFGLVAGIVFGPIFFPVAEKTDGFALVGIVISSILWSIFGTNIGWLSGGVFALRKALANSDHQRKPKTISQKILTILRKKVIDNFVSPGAQIIIGAIIAVIVAAVKTVEPNSSMLTASLITGGIVGFIGGTLVDKCVASASSSQTLSVGNTEKSSVEKPSKGFRTAISFLVDGLLLVLEGAAIGLIIGRMFDQSGSGMSLFTTYWFPFGEAFENSEGVRPGQIYFKDVYANGRIVLQNVIFLGLAAGLLGSAIDVIRLILSGLAKDLIDVLRHTK